MLKRTADFVPAETGQYLKLHPRNVKEGPLLVMMRRRHKSGRYLVLRLDSGERHTLDSIEKCVKGNSVHTNFLYTTADFATPAEVARYIEAVREKINQAMQKATRFAKRYKRTVKPMLRAARKSARA